MDAFVRQYLETALWSSTYEPVPGDGSHTLPLDRDFDLDDIDPKTIAAAERDCAAFRERAGDLLLEGDDIGAGHDFWLTRNGHGAGFWDGDWPIGGDRLTEIAKSFGEVDLYVVDDVIYAMGEEP